MSTSAAAASGFSVLMICRANHCRSVLAEFSLRRKAAALGLGWTVTSAGFQAVPGAAAHPYVLDLLRRRGEQPAHWAARQVTPGLLREADLVLTATRTQRGAVVAAAPETLPTSFTLLQFADLCASAELAPDVPLEEAGPALLLAARRARSHRQPGGETSFDLDDPIGHSRRVFARTASSVDAAVDRMLLPLARVVRGPDSARTAS